MKEERTHQECSAETDRAGECGKLLQSGDVPLRDTTFAMRAGDHAQRAVFLAASVKMEANGEHMLQHLGGWLHMEDAGLGGPWAEAGYLEALLYRDGDVLVPRDFPVRVRNFVEEDAADGKK